MMKNKIKEICKKIEKEEGIKILFAVENGSRAWRLDSKDSDYDVRFVFYRPLNEYIKLNNPNEVIKKAYDKEGNKVSVEGCFIDVVGFDIFKYTRMLWSSNPTCIEWISSDMVYYGKQNGKQNEVFKEFAKTQFKPISLYWHYKSMCRQNYLKYLKSGSLVTYKKYLYAMRGLINAKYIVHYNQLPNINFETTIWEMGGEHFNGNPPVPQNILDKLLDIIKLKRESKEKDIIQNVVQIDNFIESFLKDDSDAPKSKKMNTTKELDDEINKILTKKTKVKENE